MKKIYSVILVSFVGFAAQAQFSLTPKVGVGFSDVKFDQEAYKVDGQKMRVGILFGVGVNYAFSNNFSIQPEVLFNSKGYKAEETISGVKSKEDLSLNYLEIPILARFSFGGENFKAYINIGPSISFGLGGKYKTEGSLAGVSFNKDSKVKFGKEPANYTGDDFYVDNSLDFGAQAGGGVLYKVGFGFLNLDLRYGLGLANLEDKVDGPAGSSIDADGKNSQIAISLGYQIPLGRN